MNEKELELFEVAMDLAMGESYSGDVEDIKKLEIKIKLIDGLYKAQKEVIDKAVKYIENEMPYLQEIDKEYEDVDGNTYFTYKEYDGKELLDILKEKQE